MPPTFISGLVPEYVMMIAGCLISACWSEVIGSI
nr:MAG TPA: hypothetical protein [Caudoviricetes sp.]